MNTTTPTFAPAHALSREAFVAFTSRWKTLARAKKISREDCLLRALLLGQDLDDVLPVTTNSVRLANGARQCSGRARAIAALKGANPVAAANRRIAAQQAHAAGGKAPYAWVLEPSWGEKWVNPLAPTDDSLGLTLAQLERVIDLARAL